MLCFSLGSRLRGKDGRCLGADSGRVLTRCCLNRGLRGLDMMARAVLSAFTLTPGSSPGQALALSHRGRGDGVSVFLWVPACAGKTVGVGVRIRVAISGHIIHTMFRIVNGG